MAGASDLQNREIGFAIDPEDFGGYHFPRGLEYGSKPVTFGSCLGKHDLDTSSCTDNVGVGHNEALSVDQYSRSGAAAGMDPGWIAFGRDAFGTDLDDCRSDAIDQLADSIADSAERVCLRARLAG